LWQWQLTEENWAKKKWVSAFIMRGGAVWGQNVKTWVTAPTGGVQTKKNTGRGQPRGARRGTEDWGTWVYGHD